jgi:EAL domain-containing protein (putative c-di-GMP-specific phosphodiesterase class I)/GGDEF domain-containing protein
MQGWTPLGQLNVTLHPGYVYSGLYAAFRSTLQWLAVVLVLTFIVLWLLLHYLLLPLKKVREQADSIHNNRFVQQHKLPATTELKRVVEAMNRMVGKVQAVFSEQEKSITRYQHLLYHDPLSGLGNRRYMMDQIQQSLVEESAFHGCLVILKLANFEHLRERLDYEVTDNLVTTLADLLSQEHQGAGPEKSGRLSDDEFAFLCSVDEDSIQEYVRSLFEQFRQLPLLSEMIEDVCLVAGISPVSSGQQMGDLMSGIDYCVTQAVNDGPFTIRKRNGSSLALPQGRMQWRHWFESALAQEQFFLVGQVALDSKKQPVQKELFIRARNEQGEVIPASAFMPMASSLGMAIEIDLAVFRLINKSVDLPGDLPLALNLSSAFFELADARDDFEHMLQTCSERGIQLCIEASHLILQQHEILCTQVSDKVKTLGHQFGIDNLDLGQSLQLLQTARFDYVKINAHTLHDLARDENSSGYQALKTIMDTLDIRIIAVGVDSQDLFNRLAELGIQVMQGNLLGEPEAV